MYLRAPSQASCLMIRNRRLVGTRMVRHEARNKREVLSTRLQTTLHASQSGRSILQPAYALSRSASTSAAATAARPAATSTAAAWLRQIRGVAVERSYRVHPALNALGNASYLALASGFLMTDLLALRALLASGYLGLVCFHSLQKKPLWVSWLAVRARVRMLCVSLATSSRSACSCVHCACTLTQVPLAWSCVFVAVNAANASAIAADRWPGTLAPEEVELHQRQFNKLTPGEFKQLLDLAERRTLPQGQELTRESVHALLAARPLLTHRAPLHPSPSPHLGQEPCDQLYYIVSGRCKLYLRNVRRSEIALRSRDRNPNSGPNTDPCTALWTAP